MFGEDAAAYDDARPSYPAALIDDLVDLVGPRARMLDVGTGTAKATRLLAERGITGIGVEADPAMAAVAREHLAPFPGWRVDVSDFEWWRPSDGDAPVDLVGSAQAWHWVHPQVGLWRAHRLLRPGGHIALWWNLGEEDTSPARLEIDAAYAEHAPGEMFSPTIDRNEGSPFDPAPADTRFVDDATRLYPWTCDYSTDELLALLRTTSHLRVLPPERCAALLDDVAGIVDRHGGTFRYPYVTRLWTARRP